ncbi:growth hormone-regulated TBC protein 1-like isoform X3 [Lycorma delicatula]|uniref:growth hormone-regulated TBC protein 1-like isoform X3 n=1 Tax=Lycorma delicatula TaxID=130591 RepID=UPI003F513C0B
MSVCCKVDEYGFERPPDFDYISYEDFMSEYLKVLAKQAKKWSDLLGNGRSIMKNRLAKRYIRKGIPCEHRGKNLKITIEEVLQRIDKVA